MLITAVVVFIMTYMLVYTGFYLKDRSEYSFIDEIDRLVDQYYLGEVDKD